MKCFNWKRLLSLLLVLAIALGTMPAALAAAAENEEQGFSYEKLDPNRVSANLFQSGKITKSSTSGLYGDNDRVRAMVVLEEPVSFFGGDQEELRAGMQDAVAEIISEEILNGEELDVVWNLTSVTNAMSINVEYGKLAEIEEIAGVQRVFVETQFEPLTAGTNNTAAQEMTAAATVKAVEGLSGAGTRVAVIDTGTDLNHQAFNNEAYLQSLKLLAEALGMDYDAYLASLDLLDVDEIQSVLPELNAYKRYEGLSAEALYTSEKLPFGFNYIDGNLDVTHDNDEQGSHGSHVAGIVAANRLLACNASELDVTGDGELTDADPQALMNHVICGDPIYNPENADLSCDGTLSTYDVYLMLQLVDSYTGDEALYTGSAASTGLVGVAPDAQLITMKVFGANGGAYSSDYMAALDDAIKLGCDVVNLSLGSSKPGFSVERDYAVKENWDFINSVMEDLENKDVVVCIAAGNSGNWADYDNAYQHMYTDEGATAIISTPATYTNALSVASADNAGSVTTCKTVFGTDTEVMLSAVSGGVNMLWSSLDTDETNNGTTYEVMFLGDPSGLFYGGEIDSAIYGGTIEEDLTGKIVLVARGTADPENPIYFSDKHVNAANAGAAAVIIYNNVDETMGVSIEGSTSEVPCTSIDLSEAIELYEAFGGCTGTATVSSGLFVDDGSDVEYPAMSSFSSWGAISDLTIKPEITAPGGAIYSVEGTDPSGTAYELMSGTSMASPHVAGLAALMNEYLEREGLVEKARTVTGNSSLTLRALSQSLMMSTAAPMIEEASGLEYSVRNQGAGLADMQAAVDAETFILVEGQEDGKVKAELGDGTDGYGFSFTVYNLSDTVKHFDLSESVLTTDTLEVDGHYLVDDVMTQLDAVVSMPERITVPAGGSKTVTVSLQVSEDAVETMEALGYINGFYVEGFVYLTGSDVTHSIPMLGWYGGWSDASMYDTESTLEIVYGTADRPSHSPYLFKNTIGWTFAGYNEDIAYTGNIYGGYNEETGIVGDQVYLEDRNAISSDEDAQIILTGVYGTPIRSASAYRVQVTDANDPSRVYYEESDVFAIDASFAYLSANGAEWYDMTADYDYLEDWAVTDENGDPLPEGTEINITLTLAPEYYVDGDQVRWDELGEGTKLSFRFRVDNTDPELYGEMSMEGSTLTVPAVDNNYIAAVILLDGTASEAVSYYYPDMTEDQKGTDITAIFDLSNCVVNADGTTSSYQSVYGNKAAVVICDYAGNETYFGLNLGGEGASYGDLVGFQYDFEYEVNSWVSFSEGVNGNETRMFYNGVNFVAAEYVGGYVFAQAEDGKLYGIPYADMLANTITLEQTYIATLDNVYQDFAYSYVEGKLYGLFVYEDDGYPTSEINSINLNGEYYDEDMWMTVMPYQEDWFASRGGLYGLGLAIDDAGTFYVMGPTYDWDTESLTETAALWAAPRVVEETEWGTWVDYIFSQVGDTGLTMDYLQSMTWDHNSEKLYWARFAPDGAFETVSELYTVDPETAAVTKVGTLSSETCALFAPLSEESAAKAEHSNIPAMDATVVPTPFFRDETITMNVGGTKTLIYDLDPWYATDKAMVWSSSDSSIVSVDQKGNIVALDQGTAVITVAAASDESKFDTVTVNVTALDLKLEGIISAQTAGLGSVTGVSTYEFEMVDGVSSFGTVNQITVPEEFQGFGLSLATSVMGRGSIWACEYGNTGMIYEIDADTGVVKDVLQPIDGDMMFGLTYSEDTDTFTGIMNYYLYVDMPLTHEAEEEMLGSYDEERYEFTWHKINMLPYLQESAGSFQTGETGQGAMSEIVFCGITTIDGGIKDSYGETYYYDTYKDYMGNWAYGGSVNYQPTQTLVLLDNVGRLWYIDEVSGLSLESDEWGNMFFSDAMGMTDIQFYGETRNGCFWLGYDTDDDGVEDTYSFFNIRQLVETPLTDMFREGTMPRITYHFSDIEYACYTADGDPMFVMSLYDYWNNGTTNELYLFIPGHETDELDYETWEYIRTPDRFFDLGNTGEYNIIASIHSAEVTGGVDDSEEESAGTLGVGVYRAQK